MRYALLVCGDESVVIGHEDEAAWEAAFTSRLDVLRASGVLLSAARLCPTATATTVQVGRRAAGRDLSFRVKDSN